MLRKYCSLNKGKEGEEMRNLLNSLRGFVKSVFVLEIVGL